MTEDLDGIVADYMARLRAAVSDLSPGDRQQIIEQISEHISSARAALPEETEAGVRDILERLGTPEEIAAEARTEDDSPERRGSRPAFAAGGAVIALVVLGIGLAAALGAFSGGGSTTATTSTTQSFAEHPLVAVPAVLGENVTIAAESLSETGLRYTIRYVTSGQPIRTVLGQLPSAGSLVKSGTSVTLTVSGTGSSVTVPSVVGESQAEAEATLGTAGLSMSVQSTVPDDHVHPGVVFEQSPAAGSSVPPGADVSVTISASPAAQSTP